MTEHRKYTPDGSRAVRLHRRRLLSDTGREIVTTPDGVELQRSYVYMDGASWETLRRLASLHRTSDSKIIETLVKLAGSQTARHTVERTPAENSAGRNDKTVK